MDIRRRVKIPLVRTALRSFLLVWLAARLVPAQPSVVEDSLFAPSISAYCPMTILLPDGYDRSKKRYPVIYLLHGFNQQHSSWFTSTRLVRLASSYSFIIVSPEAKNSWYTNSVTQPELRYEDLLMKDIIPFVDGKYRTKKGGEFRSIAGLSMGGYGALKFALKYPAQFHFAAGLSPSIQFPAGLEDSAIVARRSDASNASVRAAFGAVRNALWPENDIVSLLKRTGGRALPYIYLSVGSNDNIPEIIDQTHLLAGTLRAKKISFEMHESEGGHEWNYWDSEIENVLRRISGKQK